MDIRAEIIKEHSRSQAIKIAEYIGGDRAKFENLLTIFLNDEYRVVQRSAWVLVFCVKKYPFLIRPHLEALIKNLKKPKIHNAVKRNTVRVLEDVDIPEDLLGITAEICFDFLMDIKEPIAVRVFSMTILYNICVKEPELAHELKAIIEEHLPHGSAGFKSRGKKVLKGLEKLIG